MSEKPKVVTKTHKLSLEDYAKVAMGLKDNHLGTADFELEDDERDDSRFPYKWRISRLGERKYEGGFESLYHVDCCTVILREKHEDDETTTCFVEIYGPEDSIGETSEMVFSLRLNKLSEKIMEAEFENE